jgi:hypothetical protein
MSSTINLREIERKAFRSTYQDGLWDIYFGLVVTAMAIFMYRPPEGYAPTNILLAMGTIALAGGLLGLGKKLVTLPRMGQVRFGPARQRRKVTLAVILGLVVLVHSGIVGLTALGWLNPQVSAKINSILLDRDLMDLAVASIGALFVGPSMILIAYFNDFTRGYYIAVMMSLAVFIMIWLNQPIYPILMGALIILPGVVLFVQFLRNYPLPRWEAPHE